MPEPEPSDELVGGKYRLTRVIGRGGMGSVWEGVHVSLATRVAVKFIDADYASSADLCRRFVNEARAAAQLRSKHVVQVHDQGLMEDGRPYIVMEYLSGEPLDARLDREGKLAPAEVARIVSHVARGLGRAHHAGIIHRDLKPENIFLVWDEEDHEDIAKVVDFGIAKFVDEGLAGSSATRTGSLLGTPYYMSPEQARGLRSIDTRSDLWSLAVIVYRCLVGELPFQGEAFGDILVKICTGDTPVPSEHADVPVGLDAWMRRGLAKNPGERFENVQELAESLAVVCGVSRPELAAASAGGAVASRTSLPRVPSAPAAAPRAFASETPAPGSLTVAGLAPRRRWPVAVGGLVAVGAAVALFLAVRAPATDVPAGAAASEAGGARSSAASLAPVPGGAAVVPASVPGQPSALDGERGAAGAALGTAGTDAGSGGRARLGGSSADRGGPSRESTVPAPARPAPGRVGASDRRSSRVAAPPRVPAPAPAPEPARPVDPLGY